MMNNFVARRLGLFLTVCAALYVAACKDGVEPLVPAAVQVVAGNSQVATVGAAVPIAPSVKVVTATGKPVPNVAVTFVAEPQSGTIAGGSQVTDVNGVATLTSWMLGTKAGTNTLTITAAGLTPVTVTATTNPGAPSAFMMTQGDQQQGVVGTVLPVQPAVRVTDSFGNAVPGVNVSFTVASGAVQAVQAQTDLTGVAVAGNWTLGTKSGSQTLTATVSNMPQLFFVANATPETASTLKVLTQPSTDIVSGQRFAQQPVLELRDRFDNAANAPGTTVTAALLTGTGTLNGTKTVATLGGRATFTDLSFTGTGPVQLRFTAGALPDVTSPAMNVVGIAPCAGAAMTMNLQLGSMQRFSAASPTSPQCLEFTAANAGQQYLVMFENMSSRGTDATALFPGATLDNGAFSVSIQGAGVPAGDVMTPSSSIDAPVEAAGIDGWNFGGMPAYEARPTARNVAPARVKRNGEWISTESANADLAVGDTVQMQLEGIARLGVGYGTATRRALVRYVDANIVIAEDLRFYNDTVTFRRANGGRNLPIPDSVLQSIANEYGTYAKPQADRVFGAGNYNGMTNSYPGRPIAVHTMMYSDNIWGYTYMSPNYFAWDYWVNSNGRTPDVYQHVQRNSDDLFMHEIAHMRHYGLLERAGRTAAVGNTWLVEGWARFTERLPIAARLLNDQNFSRTANVQLPLNPALILNGVGQVFFYDDVATYAWAGLSVYGGYQFSSYIYDYFADQVAAAGGNWRTALADFVTAGGVETDLNSVVSRYLPGIDFKTLYSRARVAAYLDDIGTPGLPDWTQYLQYKLRLSRPVRDNSSQALIDPRRIWPTFGPAASYIDARNVDPGGAYGYIIDAATLGANARVTIKAAAATNGSVTIVRVK